MNIQTGETPAMYAGHGLMKMNHLTFHLMKNEYTKGLLLGISSSTYSEHVNDILKNSEYFAGITVKILKTGKIGRPKRYVNFNDYNPTRNEYTKKTGHRQGESLAVPFTYYF